MIAIKRLWREAGPNASFLLALLICSKLLVIIVERNQISSIPSGLIVYGILWLLLLYHILRFRLIITKSQIILLFVAFLFVLSSNLFVTGHVSELTTYFFEYCILGFVIGMLPLQANLSLRYTCYLFLLLMVPTYILVQGEISSRWQQTITLDLSYAIMPVVIGTLVHFVYYRKREKNIIIKLAHAVAVVAAVYVAVRGTRGVALSIVFLLFLLFMNQKSRIGNRISIGRIAVILLIVLILINIDSALLLLNALFSSLDIRVSFLQKSVALMAANGDITNGRIEVYHKALEGFIRSPIWGNGIGVYTNLYPAYRFPHNIILQALFEGGVIFGFPIVYNYLYTSYKVIFGRIIDDNKRNLLIFLAASTVPASMLSSEYWVYPLLWTMFAFVNSSNRIAVIQGRSNYENRYTDIS